MTLYNLKVDGDQFRITKFTNDLEVESSYLCSEAECECPAGSRPVCRHRTMLPEMLRWDMANKPMFYDFETKAVLEQTFDDHPEVEIDDLPDGVEVLSLDDPLALHNAIADAIGEPEAKLRPHSVAGITADFDSANDGSNPSEAATVHPSIGKINRRI